MFKIGEFSKLGQVTVKALRHYDRIGLLQPAEVEPITGYRYYQIDQLPRLNRILALRELGFSLGQIGSLMDDPLSAEQIRGMYQMKQSEIEQQIESEQGRLLRVAERLRQIEQENQMSKYDVVIKQVELLNALAIRDILPNYGATGELFGELMGQMQVGGIVPTGVAFAIFYDEEYKESDVDIEVLLPVASGSEAGEAGEGRAAVREVAGAEQMATLLHQGSYDFFMDAYQALFQWIDANGYRAAGANREIYLKAPGKGVAPESYLTELQVPVVKA